MSKLKQLCVVILIASISSGITYSVMVEEANQKKPDRADALVNIPEVSCPKSLFENQPEEIVRVEVIEAIEPEVRLVSKEESYDLTNNDTQAMPDDVKMLREFMEGQTDGVGALSLQQKYESEDID